MFDIYKIDRFIAMPSSKSIKPMNFRTLTPKMLRLFDKVMAERSPTRAAGGVQPVAEPTSLQQCSSRLRETLNDELPTNSCQPGEQTAAQADRQPEVESSKHPHPTGATHPMQPTTDARLRSLSPGCRTFPVSGHSAHIWPRRTLMRAAAEAFAD